MGNPLIELQKFGQSVWYDTISRGMISSGKLQKLIDDDGLRGVTSNPAIFEKAITGTKDYKGTLEHLAKTRQKPIEIYEAIAIQDIQWAADVLLPIYESTGGSDGFISLEVSPHLAHNTEATIDDALRLATAVGRRNLMIKVPGTPEGIPAIEHLIGKGISINITLLFSRDSYIAVAKAYMSGLEKLLAHGGHLGDVSSVASFFISRIDTMVDGLLESRIQTANVSDKENLRSLLGKTAIANAKLAYQHYGDLISETRWHKLADQGAHPQRLLWASTSTKNPSYRDVMYVEELIGTDTVNTMPDATLVAFRDHGKVRPTLLENVVDAEKTMNQLAESGISISEVTDKLQKDAVGLFVEPFDKLLESIASHS